MESLRDGCLCWLFQFDRAEVHVIWLLAAVLGMRTTLIVERQVFADACSRIAHAVVGMQIDLFVLDGLPQPLDEDIVAPAAYN